VAVPWADFGPLVKKPAPGETLRMNFNRLWREVFKKDHYWALWDRPTLHLDPKSGAGIYFWPAGEVRFAGDEDVVVQLLETGNPARGQAVFKAVLRNLSKTERTLKVSVATDSKEIRETREITLKPGADAPFEYAGRIVDLATTTLAFTVADAAGGAPLHVTTLPVIRSTKPEFFVRRYRSRELTQFEVDMGFLDQDQPDAGRGRAHRARRRLQPAQRGLDRIRRPDVEHPDHRAQRQGHDRRDGTANSAEQSLLGRDQHLRLRAARHGQAQA
jgi:hypothetical protein